jgi:signal transduction histidine kinase
LDRDWVYAGSRNIAYYPHLNPGTYHFQVSAANSDGVWNSAPQELRIVVLPHFYQSLPFEVLMLCAAGSALWGGWRLRTLQFQRKQARQRAFSREVIGSQEAERKRIAAELHDGLGQRLSLISNLALLADRSNNGNRGEQIRAIVEEASQAASDVRQISRNLRPVQLDLLGLSSAMGNIARTMCESAGLVSDIEIDDLTGALPRELEIHLYRVLQECLHNIVKHAQATQATVRLRRDGGTILLAVSDNGRGFSPEGRDGHLPANGFGLIGIVERSELLGGKAVVRSASGQGTTVTVEIVEASVPL